jgi:hypothetical protein
MNIGTHMPDGERRKHVDIEVCRSKVKITTSKNRIKIMLLFFVSAHIKSMKHYHGIFKNQ